MSIIKKLIIRKGTIKYKDKKRVLNEKLCNNWINVTLTYYVLLN